MNHDNVRSAAILWLIDRYLPGLVGMAELPYAYMDELTGLHGVSRDLQESLVLIGALLGDPPGRLELDSMVSSLAIPEGARPRDDDAAERLVLKQILRLGASDGVMSYDELAHHFHLGSAAWPVSSPIRSGPSE